MFPSTSAITYWQIELLSSSIDGSILKKQQQCRLKHLCTRSYLKVDNNIVTLTPKQNDPLTVFKLHPVIQVRKPIFSIIFLFLTSENTVFKHRNYALLSFTKKKNYFSAYDCPPRKTIILNSKLTAEWNTLLLDIGYMPVQVINN